ncbi:hypothetical protein A1332_10225 [Methylomonas methanica]|uniref:Uncharacterized protein n=1 Tax=Methylomonas methanica TaxID=421 RepID=A0A177MNF3_METMH|nr:hypothetical protein A1332_10225 [Methylomonas methanica]
MDDSKLTIHGTGYPLPCGYDAQLNILANQEFFMGHIVTLPDIHTLFGNDPKRDNTALEFELHLKVLC